MRNGEKGHIEFEQEIEIPDPSEILYDTFPLEPAA